MEAVLAEEGPKNRPKYRRILAAIGVLGGLRDCPCAMGERGESSSVPGRPAYLRAEASLKCGDAGPEVAETEGFPCGVIRR
jgi:hypothetical protein